MTEWQPDVWYKVKMKFDTVNKKGSAWINDSLFVANVDLSGATFLYKTLYISSENDTHTRSWFDDVKVWYEE